MDLEAIKARLIGLQAKSRAEKHAAANDYQRGRAAGWVEAIEYTLVLIRQYEEVAGSTPESAAASRTSNESPFKPKDQRGALLSVLRRVYRDVVADCRDFDWLVVPPVSRLQGPLMEIYLALSSRRGFTDFTRPGWQLSCDFAIPAQHLIVEFDEREHFSAPRAIALSLYPRALPLCFNREEWIRHCESIDAHDNDPPYRDEQRAFYDSLRDVLAPENGYRVARLKHGAFDWTDPTAPEQLAKRLASCW
jgi:hypothetical protein